MTTRSIEHLPFGPLTIGFDERVLRPRAWTLLQSEWAAEVAPTVPPGAILELCAGAGQIGLAAAVLADRDLVQLERDPVAAGYAADNAERAGWAARTTIHLGRLEDGLPVSETPRAEAASEFPLMLADPPYLTSEAMARWPEDPPMAIDGGPDGLRLVRLCLRLAARHLHPDGVLLLQVAGAGQDAQVTRWLEDSPEVGLRRCELRSVDAERAVALLRPSAGRAPSRA